MAWISVSTREKTSKRLKEKAVIRLDEKLNIYINKRVIGDDGF